jgi:hypothetical protein
MTAIEKLVLYFFGTKPPDSAFLGFDPAAFHEFGMYVVEKRAGGTVTHVRVDPSHPLYERYRREWETMRAELDK